MPTIQFKGKNIIWNHHLSVPYHTLEEIEDLHFQPEKADGNIIVEGDNLIALKALLPQYAGKVKCIYIDPPYNTGNEGWVYNDKVNSPLINEWLGKEVGTDDLTRHDKWLCMMTPRLKLLRELLSEDGAIFISIDDNEVHNLKCLLDEIFIESNFTSCIIWNKKNVVQNDAKFNSTNHEYILSYRKTEALDSFELLERSEKANQRYENPDNDPNGKWTSVALTAKSGSESNLYEITFPNGIHWKPNEGTYPRLAKKSLLKAYEEGRLWFGKKGTNIPRLKKYLNEVKQGQVSNSIWLNEEVGSTQGAKEDIKKIFDANLFETPKPVGLIKKITHLLAKNDKNAIILDSFAGSGTTMHAVNELNKEDGGNRKCILVQMTEESDSAPDKNIAKDITRERNKLAIEKYGYDTGFKYFRVGNAIDPDALLDGELPDYAAFAKYIYYLGTGAHLAATDKIDPAAHFVGTHGPKNFYLIYEQDFDTLSRLALNLHIAEEIIAHSKGKRIVVYAPACFLDNEYLEEKQIEYVSIPYNLFEKSEE